MYSNCFSVNSKIPVQSHCRIPSNNMYERQLKDFLGSFLQRPYQVLLRIFKHVYSLCHQFLPVRTNFDLICIKNKDFIKK